MKYLKYVVFFLVTAKTLAQYEIQADTIYLSYSQATLSDGKIKTLKPKGSKSSLMSQFDTEFATKIPTKECMELISMTIKLQKFEASEDDRIELAFYTIAEDGKPDKQINDKIYVFIVNDKTITIDLEAVELDLCQDFFLVVNKIEKITDESKIKFKIRRRKRYAMYIKALDADWFKIDNIAFDYILKYRLQD